MAAKPSSVLEEETAAVERPVGEVGAERVRELPVRGVVVGEECAGVEQADLEPGRGVGHGERFVGGDEFAGEFVVAAVDTASARSPIAQRLW